MEISRIIKGIIMFILGIGTYILTIVMRCKCELSIESAIGLVCSGFILGTSFLAYGWAIMFEDY